MRTAAAAATRLATRLAVCLGGGFLLAACRTVPSLPAADFEAPGWQVRQGQAVWTARPGADGVAGELLVATRPDGASYVEFAKPPFALATAHAEPGAWTVGTTAARRRFHGRGSAPHRWVWFALATAVRPAPPGGDWQFTTADGDGWSLTNTRTGETLEGFLTP